MKVQLFNIAPAIPEPIRFLETLAHNMWWCWNLDAVELFRRINHELWRDADHNPFEFLNLVPQKRFEALVEDESFMRHLQQVKERFDAMTSSAKDSRHCIAYFSLEYGIHESLRLYSGGLGLLAGDHLKAASDSNLPLVAVGLMYRQGYFQQYLNSDGWQQEHYPENEIHRMPLQKVSDANGQHLQISVPLPEGMLRAVVWRLDVGRIPLFLMDTNIPENPPEFRAITAQLYGGDKRMRLQQELLLGIGGFRVLLAMGHEPHVCHINEGHAAFLALARVEHLMKHHHLDLTTAVEICSRCNMFTTHTPVPAGNETFHADLLRPHIEAVTREMGIPADLALSWGTNTEGSSDFSMTILGLRMAGFCNGVSRLHGQVARRMWMHLWPNRMEDEVPIRHVTNGIHVASWLSPDLHTLYDRYLGPQWRNGIGQPKMIHQVGQIPDDELWRAHELARSRLVRIVRSRMERQYKARNAPRMDVVQAKSVMDHAALTIGFARRFATYKRATLLLRDPARLEALLTNEEQPVQFVFAGKAHPADNFGKDFIRQLVHFAQRANVRHRIVFLENYDISIARSMVQGVDVWLNTPQRPNEASGTSGMKAAANGVMHASVLDGWWDEGYSKDCGWAIGNGEEFEDSEYQASVESQALYNLLENEIIPAFYDRPSGDLPTNWIHMMKASIQMALSRFSSHRMVQEYQSMAYNDLFDVYTKLLDNNAAEGRQLVTQRERLNAMWRHVQIEQPWPDREISVLHVGDKFSVTTRVHLGQIQPDEVDVEVYYGPVDSQNKITASHIQTMSKVEDLGSGAYVYRQDITCESTGRYGFTTRITPHGAPWKNVIPGFLTWANGN